MTFLILKIGLIILVAQPASSLRAKLWKVVMKCKIVMVFNFGAIYLKIYIFEVVIFCLTLQLSNQPNFCSGSLNL